MLKQLKAALVKKQTALSTLALVAGMAISGSANATTTGLEFKGFYDKVVGWAGGYLGAGLSVAALIFGIGAGVFKGSLVGIAVAVGAGLALVVGSGVLGGMFSALI